MTDTTRPQWWNSAETAAASAGVNSDTLWHIAGIESSYGKNLAVSSAGARPPFGITGGTWDTIAAQNPSLGLNDPTSFDQQAKAAAALLRANNHVLRNSLGRDPSPAEQYTGWFAGAGLAPRILAASDDTPVSALFSPRAVQQNPTVLGNGMTVGGF